MTNCFCCFILLQQQIDRSTIIFVRNLNDGNIRFHSTDGVKSLENSVLGKECILVLSKLD